MRPPGARAAGAESRSPPSFPRPALTSHAPFNPTGGACRPSPRSHGYRRGRLSMIVRSWSVILLLLVPPSARAAILEAPPHPPVQAARAQGAIRCDGVLDEPSWSAATPATELYQQTPEQGAKATMPSEFKVLFDDAALYIGARLYDAHPESIQAALGRRDASGLPADRITVYIDPYHDKRSGYLFVVNAAGLRVD